MAIESLRRFGSDFVEAFLDRGLPFHQLAVLKERLLRGRDDDEAVESIEQHRLAGFQLLDRLAQPKHGRYLQRPREEGRMGGAAADLGDEAQHLCRIKLCCVGRGEIVGDHDARLGEVAHSGPLRLANEIAEDTLGDIANVGRTLAQVRVVHSTQCLGIFFRGGVKGILRRVMFITDLPADFLHEGGVLEHEQVSVENLGFLGTEFVAQSFLHSGELLASFRQRGLEPGLLSSLIVGLEAGLGRHDAAAVQDHDTTLRHPLGNGNAAQHFFACFAPVWHEREGKRALNRGKELRKYEKKPAF